MTSRVVATICLALLVTGCGSDQIAENLVEEAAEQQSGGDADINLDDGSFSIKTEDGELSIETDEDGNVKMSGTDTEGEDFEFNADQEGNITGDAGGGDINIDADDSSMSMSDDESSYEIDDEIPADFPDSIALPDDLNVESGARVAEGDDTNWTVQGVVDRPVDEVTDEMADALESAGYTETLRSRQSDFSQLGFSGEHEVYVGLSATDDGSRLQVTVSPSRS